MLIWVGFKYVQKQIDTDDFHLGKVLLLQDCKMMIFRNDKLSIRSYGTIYKLVVIFILFNKIETIIGI